MNTKIVNALLFAAGAAIGSIVTWQLAKETYRKRTAEEIQSIRDYYKGRYDGPQQSEPVKGDTEGRNDIREGEASPGGRFKEVVTQYNELTEPYTSYGSENPEYEPDTEPYVIRPEEFGECEGFEPVCLTYYQSDDILAYDNGQIVQDVDMVVGDFKDHIGDYEPDAVHIRNEWNMRDYEILVSELTYAEARSRSPHQMEVEWDAMN